MKHRLPRKLKKRLKDPRFQAKMIASFADVAASSQTFLLALGELGGIVMAVRQQVIEGLEKITESEAQAVRDLLSGPPPAPPTDELRRIMSHAHHATQAQPDGPR